MAFPCRVSPPPSIPPIASPVYCPSPSPYLPRPSRVIRRFLIAACPDTTTHRHYEVDKFLVKVSETFVEEELWAAAYIRARSLNLFKPSTFSPQFCWDHRKYLAEREFEALKELSQGNGSGSGEFPASMQLSLYLQSNMFPDDLCASCKGIGADFARAYMSNVCVAKELHRHGLGYAIVSQGKVVTQEWGMMDLYMDVAVDNRSAKNVYTKSGFVYESDEPAWQARFLDWSPSHI